LDKPPKIRGKGKTEMARAVALDGRIRERVEIAGLRQGCWTQSQRLRLLFSQATFCTSPAWQAANKRTGRLIGRERHISLVADMPPLTHGPQAENLRRH
jgi:hypothetical protein